MESFKWIHRSLKPESLPHALIYKLYPQATTPTVSSDMLKCRGFGGPYQGRISLPLTRSMFSRKAKVVYKNNNQACKR